MIKRLITVIMLIASTGCAQQPIPDGFDWCFKYDFTTSTYGINVTDGTWVSGQGLQTAPDGLLRASWVHDSVVQPTLLIVGIKRPAGVTGDVLITARAEIFGVNVEFTETFPAALNEYAFAYPPQTAGLQSNSVNVAIGTNAPMLFTSLEVRGLLQNPFPINFCGQFTPSPSPSPTLQFTNTPAPSSTPSPSPTPTDGPSPTPTLDEQELCFDFTESSHGFSSEPQLPNTPAATYLAGVGWRYTAFDTNANARPIILLSPVLQPFTLTGVRIEYTALDTTSNVLFQGNSLQWELTGSPGTNIRISNLDIVGNYTQVLLVGNSPTHNNPNNRFLETFWISEVCLRGRNLPVTPTATATTAASPTPSRTPLGTVAAGTQRPTRTPIRIASPTPGPTQNVTPTFVTAVGTMPPTRTNIPMPTAPFGGTATPAATGTPDPGGGGGGGEGGDPFQAFLIFLVKAIVFFINAALRFFDFLSQIGYWLAGTFHNVGIWFGNLVQLIVGFFEGAVRFFVEMWEIGSLLVQILFSYIALGLSWITNAMTRIGLIFTAFTTTQPIPIPGLPTCASNPTAHDLCAVYYILDYTMLAKGTPGEYVVPLFFITMNLATILLFIKYVLKFIRRGETLTDAA
ncbi:MAG: hypothetical protein SF123_07570 [Chloroflexota bacterium]|nr:hypothetical protein [Chloroflexota bacterium]